jgi:hypothetical protein
MLRRELRLRRTVPRHQGPFVGADGRLSLAKLVAAASFPVFGLKGEPLGLRLRSPGWGSGGTPGIGETTFGYVRGAVREPNAAMELVQGSRLKDSGDEHSLLGAIESLLWNYAPQVQRTAWIERGDFHARWNLQHIAEASHDQTDIDVGGETVLVKLTYWEEEAVIIAQWQLREHPLLAGSLNLSRHELAQALGTLVVLQDDQGAVAEQQVGYDEASETLRGHHDG